MPIKIPKQKVKVSCKKCHWHLVIIRGGNGCVPSAHEMRNILLNISIKSCPKCGNNDFIESVPSAFEKINPWESIKRLRFKQQII